MEFGNLIQIFTNLGYEAHLKLLSLNLTPVNARLFQGKE